MNEIVNPYKESVEVVNPYAEAEPKESKIAKAVKTARKGLGLVSETLHGGVEAGTALTTGIAGALLGAGTGLATTGITALGKATGLGFKDVDPGEAGEEVGTGVANYLTFKPTTETGKRFTTPPNESAPADYSLNALLSMLDPRRLIAAPGEIGGELSDLPLESWNAPKSVRYPVKTVATFAAYPAAFKVARGTKNLVREVIIDKKEAKIREATRVQTEARTTAQAEQAAKAQENLQQSARARKAHEAAKAQTADLTRLNEIVNPYEETTILRRPEAEIQPKQVNLQSRTLDLVEVLEEEIPTWDVEKLRQLASKDSVLWDANDRLFFEEQAEKARGVLEKEMFKETSEAVAEPKIEVGEEYTGKRTPAEEKSNIESLTDLRMERVAAEELEKVRSMAEPYQPPTEIAGPEQVRIQSREATEKSRALDLVNALEGKVPTWEVERLRDLAGKEEGSWTEGDKTFLEEQTGKARGFLEEKKSVVEPEPPRSFKDIVMDLNTAVGKKGEVGRGEALTEVQAVARERLKEDARRLAGEARKAEVSLEEYLKEKGLGDESITRLVELAKEIPFIYQDANPSSFTLYSDPFGFQAVYRGSKRAIYEATRSDTLKRTAQDLVETTDDYLGAISTRLGNIHPSIKYKLRNFEFNKGRKILKSEEQILPFIKATEGMSKADAERFDLARKNSDKIEIDSMLRKYGIQKEYDAVRKVLDELYREARQVGFKLEFRPEYNPRECIDPVGLLDYLYKTDSRSTIDGLIKQKENQLKRYLTEDEKIRVVNSLLRGYASGQISLTKPGQLKARTISEITKDIDRFYNDSNSALLRYINDVTDAIEVRRLFGKTAKKYEGLDINNTIGAYVLDLVKQEKISPAQERELKRILQARFNEVGTSGIVGVYKNLSYIDTMGSPASAITQIGDPAWTLHKYGPIATTRGFAKTIAKKSTMTKQDIGIGQIAAEFSDKSTTAKAVDAVFKAVGLTKIDTIFKETAMNAAFETAVKQARSPKKSGELKAKLKEIFEKDADRVLNELKEGRVTEDTKLYIFNELADIQPITLSEMPVKYLTGGNGRIFYMLKSYTLKAFDVYRNEVFNLIKDPKTRVQGIKNLVSLTGYLIMMNTGADVLKDILLGRPITLEDHVIDNIYRIAGASRFTIDKAKMEGLGTAAAKQILPPFKALDAITKDLMTMGDEKGFEVTQSIPLFGKLYYWWFGKGAEKKVKKEVFIRKQKYSQQAWKEIEKFGDVSDKTWQQIADDTKLSDKDVKSLETMIDTGSEFVYEAKKMKWEDFLALYKKSSEEERDVLDSVLDSKYERLSDEDKEKYDPILDKIWGVNEEESTDSQPKFKSLLDKDTEI